MAPTLASGPSQHFLLFRTTLLQWEAVSLYNATAAGPLKDGNTATAANEGYLLGQENSLLLNGPRLISLHSCCSVSINPPTAPAQPEAPLPEGPPTSQVPWGGGAANAGIAMATIIAAMTKATVNNIMMRFISTSLSVVGRRNKDVRLPPCLTNESSLYGLLRTAHPLNELDFETNLTFDELCLYRILRTSENAVKRKFNFREFTFRNCLENPNGLHSEILWLGKTG